MTDERKIKKPMILDEAQYPEMPKDLRDKLYEAGKPVGYKQNTITQNLDDFKKVSFIDLKNNSKNNEEFYRKLKEEGYIKNPLDEFNL